jgi:hypothetical protein
MDYKLHIYNRSMMMERGSSVVLDAPTLPALRQRLDALIADSDQPLTTANYSRVEDDGLQVPLNDEEMAQLFEGFDFSERERLLTAVR